MSALSRRQQLCLPLCQNCVDFLVSRSQAVDELTRKQHKLNKYAARVPLVSALYSSFSCTLSLLNASYFENNPETDPSVVGWCLI